MSVIFCIFHSFTFFIELYNIVIDSMQFSLGLELCKAILKFLKQIPDLSIA